MSKELESLNEEELLEAWPLLSTEERSEGIRLLDRQQQEDLFLALGGRDQHAFLASLPQTERRSWVRMLPPDDAADLVQEAPPEERQRLLALLDPPARLEVQGLLAYAEDEAGGLMSPRFARVRPDLTVDQAITWLRKQAREKLETIYYVYVIDAEQHLCGVVSFRELFQAPPDKRVRDVMQVDVVTARDDLDQERLSRLFRDWGLLAIPVVDEAGRMKGIVTVDDIVDVVEEEATEDIQKIGGSEALDEPYLTISLPRMLKKRGGWLAVLFLGEMLTATAMAAYEDEIARAVVLALFVPLIISSGGNSGSQASTLVIRAMAVGEVKVRDWWRVVRREFSSGLALGLLLGAIGIVRVLAGEALFHTYGEAAVGVALTVGFSLVGVVLFGTLSGSMLPLLLRRLGLDPASASAPFVATLVDVTGLLIYFSAASLLLRGTLL
ncbi:magnesium transporter [Vulgatibacter sp.]|uniref:magnesium transporter n=1 Tax=Vulgatibacter sp. TaxID=1971226 RepID=UPI003568A0CE